MTFYWEQTEKDGLVELRCFHTRRNENFGTTRRFMHTVFVLPEDVEEFKDSFEKRKDVVEDGAWKPVPDAVWKFFNGRWFTDASQIQPC